MNVTTGTGQSSWNPTELTAEAYADPLAAVSETLVDEVIGAQAVYGPLGGCQGGTLMLAENAPSGWGARNRLIRLKLKDETGYGYVHSGLLAEPSRKPGELGNVGLLPPHTVYTDVPGAGLEWYSLTRGGRNFGIYAPYGPVDKTLNEVLNSALEPYPNSEFAVGGDLFAVLGRPENANFATIDLGVLADEVLSIEDLGVTVPPYTTHGIFNPGEGWQKYVYTRPGVPLLTPRVTGQATANPSTVKVPGTLNTDYFGTNPAAVGINHEYAFWPAGTFASSGWTWGWRLTVPNDAPTARYSSGSITVGINISGVVAQTVDGEDSTDAGTVIYFWLYGPNALLVEGKLSPKVGDFGVFNLALQIPENLRGTQVVAYVKIDQRKGHKITMTVLEPVTTVLIETPNLSAVVMPEGWAAPFEVGRVYRIKLRGWHIPPFRIIFPWGLIQMAAGSVPVWNRNEATTIITTAAWPYPGQKRGQA